MRKQLDIVTLSLLLNVFPIYIFIYRNDYRQSILFILSTEFSFLYHITYESSKLFLYLDAIFATLCSINFIINVMYSYYVWYYSTMIMISLFFYYMAIGRDKDEKRSKKYIIYHTLWHISASFTATSYGLFEKM